MVVYVVVMIGSDSHEFTHGQPLYKDGLISVGASRRFFHDVHLGLVLVQRPQNDLQNVANTRDYSYRLNPKPKDLRGLLSS